jgi:two-component system, sensor histidine kinase and response regulator
MSRQSKDQILIVDDKVNNIYALEAILSQPGRDLISATSGNDALKVALNNEVDLIILDVQMPGMDGFEVAQILKSNKKTRGTPIIFVTAELKDQKNVLKGLEEGAIDYLYKPLNPEITEAKVSVLLQLQRQRKELVEKNIELEKAQQEIKQLYADLERKNAQLELTNKELESFSYSVSHDLRAPLRSINGYAQIIREEYAGLLGDEAKRLFQIIQNNAKKMGNLIDDLLSFARMGRKELIRLPVDMNKLVEPIIADVIKATGSKATIHVQPLLPVYGDPVLLSQVYINLVSNAVKYSAKKDNPEVEIGSFEKDNDHVYYVKDNGAGFDMTYAHKLFGVFQRLHTVEEFEGTGVGLAIVQRIVVKHGGRVWAEGKVDEGATFYFSLPKPANQ